MTKKLGFWRVWWYLPIGFSMCIVGFLPAWGLEGYSISDWVLCGIPAGLALVLFGIWKEKRI